MLSGMVSSVSGKVRIDTVTDNIAIGPGAGANFNSDDDDNIAIGRGALDATTTDSNYNIAIGTLAGSAITEADANILIGHLVGDALLTGNSNVAIGYTALSSANGGEGNNVAVGYQAMFAVDHDSSDYNTAVGDTALRGGSNILASCTAIGAGAHNAIDASCTGSVAVGANAMGTGVTTAGANHTVAVGYDALVSLVGGPNNLAVGAYAADAIVDGGQNIAIGYKALTDNVSGESNVAIGYQAGEKVAPADGAGSSTCIGTNAGRLISTGVANTCVGSGALQGGDAAAPITSAGNTAVGYQALSSGEGNCLANSAVGREALESVTTGDYNVGFGYLAGTSIISGSSNTYIGSYSNTGGASTDIYQVGLGYYAKPQYSRGVALGHYGGKQFATTRISQTNFTTPSDGVAAHTGALLRVPAYARIDKVYATVTTLSGHATGVYHLEYSTTLNTSAGSAVSGTEILGAGSDTANWDQTSQAQQDPASGRANIDAGSGATQYLTICSVNKNKTSSSEGWVGSSPVGIYLCHSAVNVDHATDAVIQLTVEYEGLTA